jgi:hypothetical protein
MTMTTNDEMDLFAYAERNKIREVTEEAIARAGKHADTNWKAAAMQAVLHLASEQTWFTADDVWRVLGSSEAETHERRALGAVMRECQKQGIIRASGRYVKSKRIECHSRPVRVWESDESRRRTDGY